MYDKRAKIIDRVEIAGDYRSQPRYGRVSMGRQSGRLNSETRTARLTEMQIRSHRIKLTTTEAPVVQSRSGNVNRNACNVFSEAIKPPNDEPRDPGSSSSLLCVWMY